MSPLAPALPPAGPRLVFVSVVLACFFLVVRAEAARGRPYVNAAKTTFVGDNGSLLRGAIISTETGVVPSLSSVQGIKNVGLNTIHCYAERWDYNYSAGAKVAAVDAVVKMTRENDLYLVLTVGNGGVNAAFNAAFWNFYAPRYANETHVLYEIQNEPAAGSPPYLGSGAVLDLQLTAYGIIREAAPATPVLLMSYSSFENGAGVLQDIATLGSAIDWSNAAIAFHGYGERGPVAIRDCLVTVLDAGYPCMQTEFYRWPWGLGNFDLAAGPSLYQDVDETGDLERLGVSWLSFLSLNRVANDARFKTPLDNGGVVWAPDFGSWPVPGRAVFGNGGEPRASTRTTTIRIQAEDFDHGGEGVAYHDLTATNSGAAYRAAEGVDIQATGDAGGGHNIGWVSAGEWLEYTVIVREAGLYSLNLRVASPQAANSVRVRLAGVDLTGAWAFAGTGANQTWATISKTASLVPGQQRLRVEALTSGFNLNWIEIAPAASGILPNGACRILSRATGKAVGVVGASTSNGAKLEQLGYVAASNQRWTLTHRGANQYTITSAQTGKGIDEAAGNSLSGDTLSMWGVSGAGSAGQRWIPVATDAGHHKLVNARTGLAMTVADASAADGARIEVAEYASGAHQQWAVTAPVLVSIAATDADAGGVEGNPGRFTVTRDVVQPSSLAVPLATGGTAVAGVDFVALPASVTIPANAASASFVVSTIPGQLPSENKTVVVEPGASSVHGIGVPASATVTIRARDAFAQWAVDHLSAGQGADPAWGDPLAAPLGDGVVNLWRVAFDVGAEAFAPDVWPAASLEDGRLVLRYRRLRGGATAGPGYSVGGLAYAVEAAARPDGPWASDAETLEAHGTPEVIDARLERAAVRLKAPLGEGAAAFLRLRVTRTAP